MMINNRNPYQWILFDADNTLFDFDRAEASALERALIAAGIDCKDDYLPLYNDINRQCWRAYEEGVLPKAELRYRRFELFMDAIGEKTEIRSFATSYLAMLAEGIFLIEGARELLDQLSGRYEMVLVTNGLREVQRPRLARSGLERYFRAVIVSDEIGFNKPDHEFFAYTFATINHPPKTNALMVGDNINADIRGARDFGLDTCWYNPRGAAGEEGIEPTYEIDDLNHLPAILGS